MTRQLSKATSALLLKIASEIPNLEKENENKFGKYSYVSIDDYYSKVASIANKHGVGWVCRETQCDFRKEDNAVIFTYGFDLYSSNGEYIEDFTNFTVVHPIQGAQSSGSAASYAEKMFMRTVFKVRTGEQDADATDPNELKATPKPAVKVSAPPVKPIPNFAVVATAPESKGKNVLPNPSKSLAENNFYIQTPRDEDDQLSDNWVEIVVEAAKIFSKECKNKAEVKLFKERNNEVWAMVKEENPIAHTQIVNAIQTAYKQAKE